MSDPLAGDFPSPSQGTDLYLVKLKYMMHFATLMPFDVAHGGHLLWMARLSLEELV
jgi:hypothetical protein